MKSKPYQSDLSADESIYEYSIDNCNHLISTSLRDLSSQYKDLRAKQEDPIELNKNDLIPIVQGTQPELK